jgi:prepilin-type N-terminal cleavage/methylation domain-containing protein
MFDHPAGPRDARGFSLIEVIVAMTILAVGLLGLAQAFVIGLNHLSTSSANLIAREKAREAVESVHTARDTRVIAWANIRNVSAVAENDPEWGACNSVGGGVFQNGVQPLAAPGPDGLVNTADDGDVEEIRTPGPDGALGTADDQVQPLANFTREMQICDVNNDLREIRVIIQYTVGPIQRQYRLRTFISSFS